MDGHRLAGGLGRRRVIVGDPDLPAVAGCRTGDCDIAAEADQDAAAQGAGDQVGTVICRPGLGGRAEIEPGPWREPDRRPVLAEPDGPPAWGGTRRAAAVGPGGRGRPAPRTGRALPHVTQNPVV